MNGMTWARLAALTTVSTAIITGMVGCSPGQSSTEKINACAQQAWDEQDKPGIAPKCKNLTPTENVAVRQLIASYVLLGGQ